VICPDAPEWVLTTLEGLVGSQKKNTTSASRPDFLRPQPVLHRNSITPSIILRPGSRFRGPASTLLFVLFRMWLMSGSNYSASIASMGFFQNGGIVRAFSPSASPVLTCLSVSGGSVSTVPQKALAFLRVFTLWDSVFLQRIRFSNRGGAQGAGNGVCGSCTPPIVYRCASDLCSLLSDRFSGTWTGLFQKHGWDWDGSCTGSCLCFYFKGG
jgi:hypothetical protein